MHNSYTLQTKLFTCMTSVFKLICSIAFVLLISACQMLPKQVQSISDDTDSRFFVLCESEKNKIEFAEFCTLENWLVFSLHTQEKDWAAVKAQIDTLNDSSRELLIKILLSQHADTPYQDRLRAQNWIIKLLPDTDADMGKLLNELVYKNSQQLLEFESAITIISRVNVRQEKTIQALQSQLQEREQALQKQQDQVDQLLKIESDLIEQNRIK